MTLSSTTTKVTYNGDGATVEFAIGFVFWDVDDLRVIHRDAAGAETVWTRGTHYTVSGGAGEAGTITVLTAPTDHTPAAGETLTIKDYQAETQGDSLPLSGAFPSTVVEARLDRLTRLIQIHSEEIARSILLPETSGLSGLKIPEPGAGELLRYNPAGTSLETVKAQNLGLGVDTLLTGLATDDFLRWDAAQSAWVNLAAGATGLALLQDASAAEARAELGLGTAAVRNTGVANGDVPAMDAIGYPAADGSRIANIAPANISPGIAPRGYIDGLTLSNNATDPDHDIDIAPGVARDGSDSATMSLAALLTKRIDAAWAAGTDQGGLDGTESVAGTPDADTWYHVWLIRRSDSGAVDALFSESATSPAMPASYDQKRRIGAVLTDASANITTFTQMGDEFLWGALKLDFSQSSTPTTATFKIMRVPMGLKVTGLFHFGLNIGGSGNNEYILITSPEQADIPATTNMYTLVNSGNDTSDGVVISLRTDISGQVRVRAQNGGTARTLQGMTYGWVDPRGRYEI